jgi:cell division protein FtsI/penicillin-binding protein 2
MKLSAKLKKNLISIVSITLVIIISLSTLGITSLRTLDDYYRKCVVPEVYDNINIYDCNGYLIYDGDFSDDPLVRLSTFHIVGDRVATLSNSVLSTYERYWENSNRILRCIPEEQTVNLTIDLKLQKAAYSLLSDNGYKGTIIVSNYKTGLIKAIVSTPSIDVTVDNYDKTYELYKDEVVECEGYDYWESSILSEDTPFLNKADKLYQPGSIFYPITIAAILDKDSNAINWTYECDDNNDISLCESVHHGTQTLSEILVNNCSCGIALAADKFLSGVELRDYVSFDLEIYSDVIGYISASSDFDYKNEFLRESAIGKHETLLSPTYASSFYSTIANKGRKNEMWVYQEDVQYSDSVRIMSEVIADYLEDTLSEVTRQEGFTYDCFGTKGTAEYDNKTNTYFVCCLTDSNLPKYTVTVFLEDAEADDAVNIAKEFIAENIMY